MINIFIRTLSDLNWTNIFFLIYQSHLHECLCRTTGFREAKFTLGLNSYISMHFCEKMNTRVADCTCIYWNWQSYIHLYLVRGWGVVCKPKHFRFYILRCMGNLIKIIVNWITFTCTLAIHLWLSYIPTFTFGLSQFVYSEHFIPI